MRWLTSAGEGLRRPPATASRLRGWCMVMAVTLAWWAGTKEMHWRGLGSTRTSGGAGAASVDAAAASVADEAGVTTTAQRRSRPSTPRARSRSGAAGDGWHNAMETTWRADSSGGMRAAVQVRSVMMARVWPRRVRMAMLPLARTTAKRAESASQAAHRCAHRDARRTLGMPAASVSTTLPDRGKEHTTSGRPRKF